MGSFFFGFWADALFMNPRKWFDRNWIIKMSLFENMCQNLRNSEKYYSLFLSTFSKNRTQTTYDLIHMKEIRKQMSTNDNLLISLNNLLEQLTRNCCDAHTIPIVMCHLENSHLELQFIIHYLLYLTVISPPACL